MNWRAHTAPPQTIWGWLLEIFYILLALAIVGGIGGLVWLMRWHPARAVVESATCERVVFRGASRWSFSPDADDCTLFKVGERWLIDVNDLGSARPRQKE